MTGQQKQTDLERFSKNLRQMSSRTAREPPWRSSKAMSKPVSEKAFPFASISVLVVLLTLFTMSFVWGGWTWSSWTYALSFAILVPLVPLERERKAVISGAGFLVLFLTVVNDAGMPGYFGYSPSLPDWYDRSAHFLGAFCVTLFLWSVLWWIEFPHGATKEGEHRILVITVVAIVVLSTFFKATEYIGDFIFGFKNAHSYVDTVGDLIFNISGTWVAAILIKRLHFNVIKRPFWHSD